MNKKIIICTTIIASMIFSTVAFSETNILDQIQQLYKVKQQINNNIEVKENRMADVEYLNSKIARGVCTQKDILIGVDDRETMRKSYEDEIQNLTATIDSLESQIKTTDYTIKAYNDMLNSESSTISVLINKYLKLSYTKTAGVAFILPLKTTRITSEYGNRIHPIFQRNMMHTGVDLGGSNGDPIYTVESGTVLKSGYTQGYGNTILIMHNQGYFTLYAHIRDGGLLVKVGDNVKRGQQIAQVGSTGLSTGNHLHFELYAKGKRVNPENYIKFR